MRDQVGYLIKFYADIVLLDYTMNKSEMGNILNKQVSN